MLIPSLKAGVNTYPITIKKKYYYSLTPDSHKMLKPHFRWGFFITAGNGNFDNLLLCKEVICEN